MLERRFAFNAKPKIERLPLANGTHCFIIDDALQRPEELRQFAIDNAGRFQNVDFNAYPGVFLQESAVTAALNSFFTQHVRRLFDARRLLHLHCRLSMVTVPPAELRPYQRLCHRDVPMLDPRHSIQASILYLFEDISLGGTSFYEPAGSEEETSALFRDASSLSDEEFNRRHPLQSGYMSGSNRYFECVGSAAAQWNRIIFYDGSLLHSGDIAKPELLTRNPGTGRLTLNGFFSCRRNLRA